MVRPLVLLKQLMVFDNVSPSCSGNYKQFQYQSIRHPIRGTITTTRLFQRDVGDPCPQSPTPKQFHCCHGGPTARTDLALPCPSGLIFHALLSQKNHTPCFGICRSFHMQNGKVYLLTPPRTSSDSHLYRLGFTLVVLTQTAGVLSESN